MDMGYGHQRAAYPLKDIAFKRIITANSDKIVTPEESKVWRNLRILYEGLSKIRSVPIVGEALWSLYDNLQSITPIYPFRDLSQPSFGSAYLHWLLTKGFLKSLVDYTKKENIPFVSTFFAPAIAAVEGKRRDVYCIVTDTDVNRIWAPNYRNKNQPFYLTPTEQSTKRLIEYGVKPQNIFFTGFPLPKENTGKNLEILKADLAERLPNLDPNKKYLNRNKEVIKKMLGAFYKTRSNHPLTLTFAVGGAGAQAEIGIAILNSLKSRIRKRKLRVNITVGTRPEIEQFFKRHIEKIGLKSQLGKHVNVFSALSKLEYFEGFNNLLHTTDILWSKPSELSFYTALGIPLIISAPIGAHEICNKDWLIRMGAGIQQDNPNYTDEWLYDLLSRGQMAQAAWEGFMEAPKFGTYNIEKVLFARNKKNLNFRY